MNHEPPNRATDPIVFVCRNERILVRDHGQVPERGDFVYVYPEGDSNRHRQFEVERIERHYTCRGSRTAVPPIVIVRLKFISHGEAGS